MLFRSVIICFPRSLSSILTIKPSLPSFSESSKHVKWVEFLQDYTFVLKHRAGVENRAADALSRVTTVIHSMHNTVVGFERLKDKYSQCPDFGIIYQEALDNPTPT